MSGEHNCTVEQIKVQEHDMREELWVIGTDSAPFAGATRVITVLDPYVSPRHAQLRMYGNGMAEIRDLGTVNGVFLNGGKVYGWTPVKLGDEIHIGRTLLTLQLEIEVVTTGTVS